MNEDIGRIGRQDLINEILASRRASTAEDQLAYGPEWQRVGRTQLIEEILKWRSKAEGFKLAEHAEPCVFWKACAVCNPIQTWEERHDLK